MGFRSLIDNSIASAFKILGDEENDGLLTTITYYHVTSKGVYDPVSGKSTPTEQPYTISALRYQNRNRELDGNKIDVNEARLIIQSSEFSFLPTKDDRITIGAERFHINNLYQPPGQSIWTIELRGT